MLSRSPTADPASTQHPAPRGGTWPGARQGTAVVVQLVGYRLTVAQDLRLRTRYGWPLKPLAALRARRSLARPHERGEDTARAQARYRTQFNCLCNRTGKMPRSARAADMLAERRAVCKVVCLADGQTEKLERIRVAVRQIMLHQKVVPNFLFFNLSYNNHLFQRSRPPLFYAARSARTILYLPGLCSVTSHPHWVPKSSICG